MMYEDFTGVSVLIALGDFIKPMDGELEGVKGNWTEGALLGPYRGV